MLGWHPVLGAVLRRILCFIVLAGFGALAAQAVEIKKDGWLFPQPALAEKMAIRPKDYTDRIPGQETLVKIYKKKTEDVVFDILEIDGEVYACQFHIKGKDGEPPTVYVIVDEDGDGVFESKYSAGETARPPEWVIQRYFKKHPEQKDPGPAADAHRGQ
jgi:hypothetical protein